jgi:HSP20 family protein
MKFNLPSLLSDNSSLQSRSSTGLNNIFDSFLSDSWSQLPRSLLSREAKIVPQLDASETDSHYYLELDLAGMNKKDINLKVDNNILTIKGKRELDTERKDDMFYIRERFYGDFQRSLSLPIGLDTNKIDADFQNGVLTIKIPKTSITSTKNINIKG